MENLKSLLIGATVSGVAVLSTSLVGIPLIPVGLILGAVFAMGGR